MGVPKRLTEMQKRFAEFIVFGGPEGPVSQMEAAKLAGYSHNRARQEGSELMNPRLSPLVAKFVGELKEERLKKFEVNYQTHIAELDRIKNLALKKGIFFLCSKRRNQSWQSSRTIHRQKNNKTWEIRRANRGTTRNQNETNSNRLRRPIECEDC